MAVAVTGLFLGEYGTADIDDASPGSGNLGDITFLDAAVYAYLHAGTGGAELNHFVQHLGYKVLALGTGIDRQEEHTVYFAD